MPNGETKFEQDFRNTMHSKAALDAAHAVEKYYELIKKGWSPDKAFLVAFMGIPVLSIPGLLKPPPKPDPPFLSMPALYREVKKAHVHVSDLKAHIEASLVFLESIMKNKGKK